MSSLISFLLGSSLLTAQLGVSQHAPEASIAPNATGSGGWDEAFSKAKSFTSKLDLDEKIYVVTGVEGPCVGNIPAIERLNFGGICLQDGPLAIRQVSYASAFPAGVAAAATWDRDLIRRRSAALGKEYVDKGAHVMLGPVGGPLGKSPYGGRNWEGFSIDPYLTGVAMYESVVGSQSSGIQACAKHYIGNEQETQRNPTTDANGDTILAISSNIDDRTMHELYLWPFVDAVKAGVASVMCSYNRINETYGCENSETLNDILKTDLGFQGYVVSDWGGTHSGLDSIRGGLDMDMPGNMGSWGSSYFGKNISTMIKEGKLQESKLDDMIHRIMMPYYYLKQDKSSYPTIDLDAAQINAGVTGDKIPTYNHQFNLGTKENMNRDVRGNHAALIREIGAASAVLLKNKNNALPLKSPNRIAVFGNDAADLSGGPYDPANEIGAQAIGGGSGQAYINRLISPLEAIRNRNPNALIQSIYANDLVESNMRTIYPIPDVCLVFLKTYAEEGADLTDLLADYDSSQVVETVTSSGSCPNTIIITHSPGPNIMPWADNENVTAIIAAHYPGEQIGNAIADILSGDVNPSGKLPYTIAKQASDYDAPIVNKTGSTDPNAWQDDFNEGLMVDYRHFDHEDIDPLYEFGFGLSYTNFSLSNLDIKSYHHVKPYPPPLKSDTPPPGGNPALYDTVATITAQIQNKGSMTGSTVPQLYLSFPVNGESELDAKTTPKKVLRGFEKVQVRSGESEEVRFELRRRDVSFWDVRAQEWKVPKGVFGVAVGESSRDLGLKEAIRFV